MSLNKERAWQMLKDLDYVRVTGTDEERKAASYLKEKCLEAGVPAEIENYEINAYGVTDAEFTVIEPYFKKYAVTGIGMTGSCKETEAELLYIGECTDEDLSEVKGKICLGHSEAFPGLLKKLSQKGAAGYLCIVGSFRDDDSLKKELRTRNAFGKGDILLPSAEIHISDAEELLRSKASKVRFRMNEERSKTQSGNVVATIEGSDLKNEIIAVTAHYDSVPFSHGIYDNGTGSATVMELMHHFAENRPRRTLKFIWCGSEENGCTGSKEYCMVHKDDLEHYIFDMNFDMTGVTVGYESVCVTASEEVAHQITYLAKLNNHPLRVTSGSYSSDSQSFASSGVPSVTFARLAPKGGAEIHNHLDNFDHLDPDSFMITLDFACRYLEQIANCSSNLIPRSFSEEVSKSIEARKRKMSK